MPVRDFDTSAQAAPVQEVQAARLLSWVELDCPNCGRRSYVAERIRRLNRTGSRREYAPCPWCAVQLTAGRVVKLLPPEPSIWRRLWSWRPTKAKAHTFQRNGH
jgi:hypothetical protein